MTKTGWFRGFAAALLAVTVLVGCGGDSGTGKITVTVDGNGLPADMLARITTICIRVEGDLEQVETAFPVPAGAFDDGSYEFSYSPKNASGVLRIIVTAKDADGNIIAANTVDAEIIPGKVTPATVTLSGQAPIPLIVLEPATVDYGALVLGAAAGRQTVTVRNAGGAIAGPLASTISGDAVFVLDASTSCDGRMLAPAESCMMTLEFRPAEAGVRSARLEVTATPGGVVSATLTGSAMTPAELAISPDTASLGDVEVGQAGSPVTITVTNNGGVASGALAAILGGSSAAEVSLGADTCTGVALAPAATCTLALTLRPTSAGVKAAMLTVTGAPGGSVVTMLAGRGLTPSALGLTPTSQDFGTTVTNAQAEASFVVRNGGEVATGMVMVTLGGANASEFSLPTDNCSGAALAPAATCTVTVRFLPTTMGAKAASLRVRATPGGDITATLAGTAVPPGALSLSPASADFGGVVLGSSSSTLTFTATNTGGAATGLITVALSGTSANQYSKLTDTCSATSVAPAGTCTVSYQLRPTTAGSKTASLVISATPGGTATAALSGAGLSPALLSGSATTAALGTVDVGSLGLPFTWTITNVGGVPTGVVATSITGNSADFTVGGNCNSALAPNQSCQLTVTLSPTTGGAKSLTISASGTPGGTVQLVASGTARPPQVLTVTRMGNGMSTGTVTATGISCGTDCSEGYRFGTRVTLTASVSTGTGFTGWSGACMGTGACVVTMDQAQSVVATFTLNKVNLAVSTSGTATGSVTSAPGGITCGADCAELYDYGTPVVLTAMPAPNYSFGGWSGACMGLGTCSVTMTVARNVTAIFTLNTSALNISLVGGGRVTSTPAGIDCGSDCGEAYTTGTVVQLSASASTGYSFGGWTASAGTCTGTTTPCSVTMSTARSLTATFNPIPVVLTVGLGGKGSGTITSSPGTINCGTTCMNTFNYGTAVTLTATPAVGHRISGWSGGGCTNTGSTCVVTPIAATSVRVDFERLVFTLDVTRSGVAASKGLVTDPASSGRISCGADCSDTWSYGDVVTLTANANGNIFAGWNYGTCGTALTCAVTVTSNLTVNARFEIPVGITVRLAGGIPGNIVSSPAGISCNYPAPVGTCSAQFTSNSTVRLVARPATNYGFLSWDSRSACAAYGVDPVCYLRLGTADEVAIGIFYKP